MATKGKKTTKPAENETNVTRITAKDDKVQKKAATVTPSKEQIEKPVEEKTKNPFKALGRYFKGAWFELKQVRWPTRRATWSLTLAVLAYTAFFVVVILLLDALFKYLFELMLG